MEWVWLTFHKSLLSTASGLEEMKQRLSTDKVGAVAWSWLSYCGVSSMAAVQQWRLPVSTPHPLLSTSLFLLNSSYSTLPSSVWGLLCWAGQLITSSLSPDLEFPSGSSTTCSAVLEEEYGDCLSPPPAPGSIAELCTSVWRGPQGIH